jgi:hypothetical protein
MRTFEVPAGTTPRGALLELFPREHAARVPAGVRGPPYRAVVKLRGEGGGSFTVSVDGRGVDVAEGESPRRDLWLVTDVASFGALLDDASGPYRIVPREIPGRPPVEIASDPRLVQRMLLLDGSLHVSMSGVPGPVPTLWAAVGCGPRATRFVDEHEPDARVEVPFTTFQQLASGEIDIESARANGRFRVRGSALLAMQFGLAMTLLAPIRGGS